MALVRRGFLSWLPLAVAVTCLGMLGYGAVQQTYRTGANDPQVQLAHDTARAIASGASPERAVAGALAGAPSSAGKVDLGSSDEAPGGSLAPFVIVYGGDGAPLVSSAVLAGKTPVIPQGVLDAAKSTGENVVTWQPTGSLRIAAVAVPVGDGSQVVIAGRSLREVERRIGALGQIALLGWVFTLVAAFVATLIAEKFAERA